MLKRNLKEDYIRGSKGMNNENFELNEENIEALLIDGIAEGHLEIAGVKNGELGYSLTKSGENHIEELLGGIDVAENTKRLLGLLVKYKALGFDVPETFLSYIIIAAVLRIVKHYENWETLTGILAKEVED